MEQAIYPPKWFALNFVPCPCCNSQMVPKPVDGEWNNVFCTFCDFACRFVVAPNTPHDKILALRKAELEDLLQLKKNLPPLMIHFKWESEGFPREQVEFWPFIAYRFLKEEHRHPIDLNPDAIPDVVVFSNMFDLPHMTLYESPSNEEIAEEIAQSWPLPILSSTIQEKYSTGYLRAAQIKDKVLERLRTLGKLPPDADEDDL